jgi:hypothetical protein
MIPLMSNYIQKELGGQKRGLKFTIGTVLIAKDLAGTDVENVPADLQEIALIVYSALLNNCRSKKTEPDFTLKEVGEWVMDFGSLREIKEIKEAFEKVLDTGVVPTEGN